MNFKAIDDAPAETLNKILWWDAKGWNTRYPDLARPKNRSEDARSDRTRSLTVAAPFGRMPDLSATIRTGVLSDQE